MHSSRASFMAVDSLLLILINKLFLMKILFFGKKGLELCSLAGHEFMACLNYMTYFASHISVRSSFYVV